MSNAWHITVVQQLFILLSLPQFQIELGVQACHHSDACQSQELWLYERSQLLFAMPYMGDISNFSPYMKILTIPSWNSHVKVLFCLKNINLSTEGIVCSWLALPASFVTQKLLMVSRAMKVAEIINLSCQPLTMFYWNIIYWKYTYTYSSVNFLNMNTTCNHHPDK